MNFLTQLIQLQQKNSDDLDKIKVTGQFTFKQLILSDKNPLDLRKVDNILNVSGFINPVDYTISDIGNGTYWVKQVSYQNALYPDRENGTIVQLRNWYDDSVITSGYFLNIDKHELRPGAHPLEAICITWIKVDNLLVNYVNAIMILDFSKRPIETKIINPMNDFDPEQDWGMLSIPDDWMHANSAGVDIDGNQFMNGRHGSFLVVQDRLKLTKKFVVSSEFRSDQQFSDSTDKFQSAHDAHQLSNGNWLIFDNGNGRPEENGGQQTRCIEYQFDYVNMMVSKLWEFKIELFCSKKGSCRRLSNENTVIGFFNCEQIGSNKMQDQIQEVDKQSNIIGQAFQSSSSNQRAIPIEFEPKDSFIQFLLSQSIQFVLIIIIVLIFSKYQNKYQINLEFDDDIELEINKDLPNKIYQINLEE